jgi:N-acetylmuramoyl-L-alanine amidase
MQPISEGARGEAVLDVQARLVALGYDVPGDERADSFGAKTTLAVRAFQQDRGLRVDGIVGEATWRELVEASLALGDRVLYLRAPHMRGDDVRGLQDRLQTLGFGTGRTDGIFGPRTAQAIREFQRNYGLPADGIVAEGTLRAMLGLARVAGDTPVGIVHEREAMRRRPAGLAGLRVVIDPGHGGEDGGVEAANGAREADLCFTLAARIEAALAAAGAQAFLSRRADSGPEEQERIALANALDVDVYLGLHLGGDEEPARGVAAFYFGHERFRSESGARLAEILVEEIAALGLPDGRTHAKTFPALRETRMTAVVLEPGYLTNPADAEMLTNPEQRERIALAIVESLARFTRAPAQV